MANISLVHVELSISALIMLVYNISLKQHPYLPHYSTHCILVIDGGFQEGVDDD
jgi:hypothetical protein